MRIAVIIIRVLMGIMFLFSAVVVLFNLVPTPVLTGKVKLFNEGLAASGYFIPFLKSIELICSIALITGFYARLATIVIFPVTVHIFLFHAFLAPEGIIIAALLLLGNLFLIYNYRESYKPMLSAK